MSRSPVPHFQDPMKTGIASQVSIEADKEGARHGILDQSHWAISQHYQHEVDSCRNLFCIEAWWDSRPRNPPIRSQQDHIKRCSRKKMTTKKKKKLNEKKTPHQSSRMGYSSGLSREGPHGDRNLGDPITAGRPASKRIISRAVSPFPPSPKDEVNGC
ncbi:hypothetical protein BDV37DRAFT_252007 [Aspergillus pseudonomiae]|uniref:Uncharacterized protein n=1 Tax=Aspergillus pseudonomiae TaxID=1506151 RepID=A0A5N7D8Y6_9EURO|nr:uncharacterized protein BDV37DRAFT_252007 [Aspergillus pseudonomiae]KAE8402764.1 hypothetical protein BDV37DRAFT_252007 [Aspergillus pseudonomiae]